MKVKEKKAITNLWDGAALVVGSLLLLDVLVCLVLLFVGIGLLLLNALEIGLTTAVLILLGCIVYFIGKKRGAQTRWCRLLLGGIIAGGVVIMFFCVTIVAMTMVVLN